MGSTRPSAGTPAASYPTSYQPFFTTAPTSAPEIPLQERPEQRAINRQTKRSSNRWQGGNAISKGGDSKIPTTSVQVGGVVTLETNIKMCNKCRGPEHFQGWQIRKRGE